MELTDWKEGMPFIILLIHLPYVCSVYFLMGASASVKLDNKSLLTIIWVSTSVWESHFENVQQYLLIFLTVCL